MTDPAVDAIARAVLYEGYVLYPYRPCVKTQQRWTFGGIFPRAHVDAHPGSDAAMMQCQSVLTAENDATLSITLRLLHLMQRTVQQGPDFHPVASLRIGNQEYQSWQEAVERDVTLDNLSLADLLAAPLSHAFSFPQSHTVESLSDNARLLRQQHTLTGLLEISARTLPDNLTQLTLRIHNTTPIDPALDRDAALLYSFASTHLMLRASAASFLSLTDPPPQAITAVAACENIGCWPVLVGAAGQTNTLLASPIILPDYPQIAPQSPGDLFDGCEIDEILTLRILTLTDDEKQKAAAVDPRVSALMQRTESLARDQLMNLHGVLRTHDAPANAAQNRAATIRERSAPDDFAWPGDNPFDDKKSLESYLAAGIELHPGDRVRLRPRPGADIFDLALAGKSATIAAIEQDYENTIHLAVTVDDDPGADFGIAGKPGHRFFFRLDEIEPLTGTPS